MKRAPSLTTADLSSCPDLAVIYLGMKVNSPAQRRLRRPPRRLGNTRAGTPRRAKPEKHRMWMPEIGGRADWPAEDYEKRR